MTTSSQTPDNFELSVIGGKLRRNALAILVTPIIFLAAALIYTLIIPAKFEADTTLYFPPKSANFASLTGAAGDSGLASLALGGGPSSLKIFQGFLESQTCLDYVEGMSGVDRKKVVDARSLREDQGASMLTISETLPDGQLAKKLLQYHLDALGIINARIYSEGLASDTQALRQELTGQQNALHRAESNLANFQNHADSAPSTTPSEWAKKLLQAKIDLKSAKSALASASSVYSKSAGSQGLSPSDIPPVQEIRPKLIEAQLSLKVLLATFGPASPEVQRAQKQVDALRSQLKNEVNQYLQSVQSGLIDPTNTKSGPGEVEGLVQKQVGLEAEVAALTRLAKVSPKEQQTLAHLALQVSIQSDIVKYATLQLEQAKLQSFRDPAKWTVLDPPRIEPKPVNKRYLMTALVAVFAGLFVSCTWALNFGRSTRAS